MIYKYGESELSYPLYYVQNTQSARLHGSYQEESLQPRMMAIYNSILTLTYVQMQGLCKFHLYLITVLENMTHSVNQYK